MSGVPPPATGAEGPVLSVEGLSVSYRTPDGPMAALRDVSFAIAPGEAVALVGESGSGKSTVALAILDLLAGEATVEAGRIRFLGEDLGFLDRRRRAALRGSRIGSVFQDPFTSLNPSLPIGLQVSETLIEHQGMPREAALERAVALLGEVGIPAPREVVRRYPHQLSGGMQQRALIAGALACSPALLVLDEPTTALDVTIEAQIRDLLQDLQRRHRLGILFITHNLGIVGSFCDRVVVLYAGEVLEEGPAARTLTAPRHPYAKGLMASMPRLDRGGAGGAAHRLPSIPGRLPDLTAPPEGCIFAARCAFAEAACAAPQRLAPAPGGGSARCWKAAALEGRSWPVEAAGAAAAPRPTSSAAPPLVEIAGLRKTYAAAGGLAGLRLAWVPGSGLRLRRRPPARAAVDGVSLAVAAGEVLGLVGESGCGKSTLGRCLLRLVPASGGRIRFEGVEVSALPEKRLRRFRQRAQMVFQNPDSSLNPRKTVGAIIARPLRLFAGSGGRPKAARIAEILATVGLPASYAERYPHQLSGGEKQRVGIARALAVDPAFLVCDEAVSALDVSVQATILNLLAELRDRLGLCYLFISHDLAVVAHLADRIAVMYGGVLVETGATRQILAPPYHPYTEALLSALPRPAGGEAPPRIRLPADGPGDAGVPAGCRFHRRCPRKLGTLCETVPPPSVEAAPGHHIACHIPLADLARLPPVLPLAATEAAPAAVPLSAALPR